ncbi:MAG: hypothetical protein HY671_02650 [Chloroflexi bacterium]|nr:hypothetical protein [Chloroflexota bacterium]
MGLGGLGLGSVKSLISRRQGQDDAGKAGQGAPGPGAIRTAPAKAAYPGAIPFQVAATPPQPLPTAATQSPEFSGVAAVVAPPPGMTMPTDGGALPGGGQGLAQTASPEAAPPPGDDKKKLEKDILDLFRQEEATVSPLGNLAGSLPDVDISALYKECLDMKGKLSGWQR